MKRDMDLVRRILVELSEASGPIDASVLVTDRISFEDVCYHFRIMDEAGLIRATVTYAGNEPWFARANELTWDGNEFLSAVRSDSIWQKAKSRIARASVDAPLDVVKALAVKLAESAVMAGL